MVVGGGMGSRSNHAETNKAKSIVSYVEQQDLNT